MTKISNFICIKELTNGENEEIVLREPMTNLVLDVLPNNFSFFVLFSIIDIDWDIEKSHYLELSLINSEGKALFDSNKIEIPLNNSERHDVDNLTANFSLNNVKFISEGLHKVELHIDDMEAETYFVVKKKQDN